MIAARFYEKNYSQEQDLHSEQRLVESYENLQDFEKLEAMYEKLVQKDPAQYAEKLAMIQLKQGKYSEAESTLENQLLQSDLGLALLKYAKSKGACKETCEENEVKTYCLDLSAVESIDPGNPNVKFYWEHEGQKKSGINAQFCFKTAGEKVVYLHAKDMNTGVKYDYVDTTIVEVPEQNNFNISNGETPELWHDTDLKFSAGTLNENYTYLWDFGDGNFKLGAEVTHRYKQGGIYPIRLLVYAPEGECKSCVHQNTEILYYIK